MKITEMKIQIGRGDRGAEKAWSLHSCTISNDRSFKETVSLSLISYLSLLAKIFLNKDFS